MTNAQKKKALKEYAAKGGRAGKGASKRRPKSHYIRIAAMAAKKRIALAKARRKALKATPPASEIEGLY